MVPKEFTPDNPRPVEIALERGQLIISILPLNMAEAMLKQHWKSL